MSKPIIDPEIENCAREMSARLGEQIRQIMRDNGMTEEEINKTMHDAIKGIRINGVPVLATACPACDGKGWVLPDEEA